MAKPTQSRRVVPEVRGAFQRALMHLHEEGLPLSDIIVKEFKENPLRALDTLAKFCPKEMLMSTENEDGETVPFKVEVNFVSPEG